MFRRQEGMTGVSMLIVVIVIVFIASLAIKIVPIYVDDSSIKTIVSTFQGNLNLRGKLKKDVLKIFNKQLSINNITDFNLENVTLTRKGSDTLMVVEYEPRGELIGSLDFIIHFKHEATFPTN